MIRVCGTVRPIAVWAQLAPALPVSSVSAAPHCPVQYIIAMLIAAAVAFVLSWLFGLKPEQIQPQTAPAAPQQSSESTPEVEAAPKAAEIANDLTITAPLTGNAVSLTETGDETFAQEVLGPGIAIEPTVGKVVAPCDATISAQMGHAVGLSCDNGAELLIHVGVDTVELGGKCLTGSVTEGQRVKAGDTLLTFDMDGIRAAGYKTITAIIVTNGEDFASVDRHFGTVQVGDQLLTLRR
ncbi:MAG: PTS glucose transporter subunit IIA [Butyricicoccus pullicaecorum]